MLIYGLLALLIALNVGDILTTRAVIARGGSERNPIAAALMDRLGFWPAVILLKAAVVALCVAILVFDPAYWWVMIPLCALAAFAILHNVDSL